eukprot:UN34631
MKKNFEDLSKKFSEHKQDTYSTRFNYSEATDKDSLDCELDKMKTLLKEKDQKLNFTLKELEYTKKKLEEIESTKRDSELSLERVQLSGSRWSIPLTKTDSFNGNFDQLTVFLKEKVKELSEQTVVSEQLQKTVNMLTEEKESYQKELDELKSLIAGKDDLHKNVANEVEEVREKTESMKLKLNNKDKELNEQLKRIDDLKNEIARINNNNNEQDEQLTMNNRLLQKQISDLKQKLETTGDDEKTLIWQKNVDELKVHLKDKNIIMKEKAEKLNAQSKEIVELLKKNKELENRLQREENEISMDKLDVRRGTMQKSKQHIELQGQLDEFKNLQEENMNMDKKLESDLKIADLLKRKVADLPPTMGQSKSEEIKSTNQAEFEHENRILQRKLDNKTRQLWQKEQELENYRENQGRRAVYELEKAPKGNEEVSKLQYVVEEKEQKIAMLTQRIDEMKKQLNLKLVADLRNRMENDKQIASNKCFILELEDSRCELELQTARQKEDIEILTDEITHLREFRGEKLQTMIEQLMKNKLSMKQNIKNVK